MNISESTKIQEGSSDREEAVYKLASRTSQERPEVSPITLELKQTSIGHFTLAGFDAFNLKVQEVTDGGRHREQRSLEIVDGFMHFVSHTAYEGLMKVVPATEHNLDLLASHNAGNKWFIHEEKWRLEVEKRAEALSPIRDEKRETEQPKLMPHRASEEEKDREIADLKAKLASYNGVRATDKPTAEEFHDFEDVPEVVEEPKVVEDPTPKPLEGVIEDPKKRVYEKHGAEIEEMKSRGIKRIDMTKEYKAWLEEELQEETV